MEFIAHRVNTIEQLLRLPNEYGAEIDLRAQGNEIVLEHDPYAVGDLFSKFANEWDHGILLLNIKCEEIEWKVLEILRRYNINKYFFLDCTFPMIVKLSNQGENRIAIRFSEYEGLDTIRNMRNRVQWVWVDCFTHLPITKETEQEIHSWGLKTCLVSPDLVGRPDEIEQYALQMYRQNLSFDAICTRECNIDRWKKEIL